MFNKCVWVFALAACRCASAESLSLAEAMDKAVRASPMLAALSANAESQASAEKSAGRLPEPRLSLSLQNVPVTGPQSWSVSDDSMTMRAVGLMQDVPNRAKRRADVDKAGALAERATAELHLKTLEVRRDTALAWLERIYLERQVALLDALGQESALLEQTATAGVSRQRNRLSRVTGGRAGCGAKAGTSIVRPIRTAENPRCLVHASAAASSRGGVSQPS